MEDINAEFQEMKTRYIKFIRRMVPMVKLQKHNLFYDIVDENKTKEKLMMMARETRPFMAKETWDLLDDYMQFLSNLPNIEGRNYKVVYENFSRADFVKRLLFKRPIVFYRRDDSYIMRGNQEHLKKGSNDAEKIAKILYEMPDSKPYLKEYISYDENLMSSLIGMSTPTYYFSIGGGSSKANSKWPHIDEGILCGLVGARNSKTNFMEHHFVFPRKDSTTSNVHQTDDFWIKNVYSDAFPEGKIPTINDIKKNPDIYDAIYFDGINEVYLQKRLMLSILPYLREAASRGIEKNQNIFVSVPPIGAGVWAGDVGYLTVHRLIINGILKYLDENFSYEDIKYLKAMALPEFDLNIYKSFVPKGMIRNISVDENDIIVNFKEPADFKIKIINKIRFVAELLPEEFKECISIAGYAWDGNSYPGNEYWVGLMGSFDPQAIHCSLLGQFQNPEINLKLADEERIRVY